jgi:hypothetical protein
MTSTTGAFASALAIRLRDEAAMGLPLSAALTVAGLIRAARARSTGLQPLRVISWRSRPGWTLTLIAPATTPRQYCRRMLSPPR